MILDKNSLNLNFEHCVNFLIANLKKYEVILLRRKVEPKYSITDF